MLLAVVGAGVLVVGSHHFENGWPGTGAHAWAQQGLVPGGIAAFCWAGHAVGLVLLGASGRPRGLPARGDRLDGGQPVALTAGIAGLTLVVRRLDLSPRILRFEARVAGSAVAVMAVFLAGAGCWVVAVGSGPGLLHADAVDVAGLVVMLAALFVARWAIDRAGKAPLGLSR